MAMCGGGGGGVGCFIFFLFLFCGSVRAREGGAVPFFSPPRRAELTPLLKKSEMSRARFERPIKPGDMLVLREIY